MNDTVLVQVLQALCSLPRHGCDLALRHQVSRDDICERPALHVLHHNPQFVLVEERIDVVDDVRVARGPHNENLVYNEIFLGLLVEIHLLDRDGHVRADLICREHTTRRTTMRGADGQQVITK